MRAMSQVLVNLLRQTVDAFNAGDFEAAAQALDADSQWDWSKSIGPDQGVYRGREEIRHFWEGFAAVFEEICLQIEEVADLGDLIVASMVSFMRGRGGVQVQAKNAWLIEGRGPILVRLTMFQTKDEALEAARLSA